jgi:hypothetical protein
MKNVPELGFHRQIRESKVRQRIRQIAVPIFKKLALAFTLSATLISFGIRPFSVMLLAGASAAILVDAGVRFLATRTLFGDNLSMLRRFNQLADLIFVNLLGLAGPSFVIHELGHALAAELLLKDPRPHVQFQPFVGGATSFNPRNGLSALGEILGQRGTILAITAAGLMASTLCAMAEFAVAFFTDETNPTLAEFLRSHGVCQILNEVCYGLSTFVVDANNLSHDFLRLYKVGRIHPLVPMALMILFPVVEVLILRALDAGDSQSDDEGHPLKKEPPLRQPTGLQENLLRV